MTIPVSFVTPLGDVPEDTPGRKARLAKGPKPAVATGATGPHPAGTRERASARH
jgi:hypothetical protein